MAIAKRPDRHRSSMDTPPQDDHAAEAFITGAEAPPAPQDTRKVPILVRVDRALLARVDRVAKRRGVSRSSWVHYHISQAVEAEEERSRP